jgi:hypothetical protein
MTEKRPPQEPGAWDRFAHGLHTSSKHREPKDKPESSPPKEGKAIGVAIVVLAGVVIGGMAHAQTRMDRALDVRMAKCEALQQRSFDEGAAEVATGVPDPEKALPLQDAARACWADYNRLQDTADQADRRARTMQRIEANSAPPAYFHPSPDYQPPPAVPPPQQPLDLGYSDRPEPPVTCAGQVMVLGPPGEAARCAGPQ